MNLFAAARRASTTGTSPPADPSPPIVDLRRAYVQAVDGFVAAKRRFDHAAAEGYRSTMRLIRDRARLDGHQEAMEAVWTDVPDPLGLAELAWFEAATGHKLHGGPDPGPKPPNPREWAYWAERHRAVIAAVVAAHRSGDPAAVAAAQQEFSVLPRVAAGKGHYHLVMQRFTTGLPPGTDADTLAAWEAAAVERLEHGPPPAPAAFVRTMEAVEAQPLAPPPRFADPKAG